MEYYYAMILYCVEPQYLHEFGYRPEQSRRHLVVFALIYQERIKTSENKYSSGGCILMGRGVPARPPVPARCPVDSIQDHLQVRLRKGEILTKNSPLIRLESNKSDAVITMSIPFLKAINEKLFELAGIQDAESRRVHGLKAAALSGFASALRPNNPAMYANCMILSRYSIGSQTQKMHGIAASALGYSRQYWEGLALSHRVVVEWNIRAMEGIAQGRLPIIYGGFENSA